MVVATNKSKRCVRSGQVSLHFSSRISRSNPMICSLALPVQLVVWIRLANSVSNLRRCSVLPFLKRDTNSIWVDVRTPDCLYRNRNSSRYCGSLASVLFAHRLAGRSISIISEYNQIVGGYTAKVVGIPYPIPSERHVFNHQYLRR